MTILGIEPRDPIDRVKQICQSGNSIDSVIPKMKEFEETVEKNKQELENAKKLTATNINQERVDNIVSLFDSETIDKFLGKVKEIDD